MKNIYRSISLVILLFAFTINADAQNKKHKEVNKEMVKHLLLTKQQQKEIKASKQSTKKKKEAIKNNSALTEQQKKQQLAELRDDKHAKLEAILSPEQKEKMKQAKDIRPRRGVTDMPNERTGK